MFKCMDGEVLNNYKFNKIGSVQDLINGNEEIWSTIPNEEGIYVLIYPGNISSISFIPPENEDDKDKCNFQPERLNCVLQNNNSHIIYIGMTTRILRDRLKEYMRCSINNSKNHKGGRAIWQMDNKEYLNLEVYVCPIKDARSKEKELLELFKEKSPNHFYPVANMRG